ncbi:MAG: CPBP family intramembrane metalloprotease [Phycisphaerales bacterium]|jgi:membrane protease YdiL (CAAX protease family)|nr:CPBP family intramembrane metalloprotease [Phycisphaerales bacterium]
MNQPISAFVKTSWVLILLFVAGIAYLQTLSAEVDGAGDSPDEVGLAVAQVQAELILAQGSLLGSTEGITASVEVLNTGTVDQRQRVIAFMIGLGDVDAAKSAILSLQSVLSSEGVELNEQQSTTQEMLDILCEGGTLPAEHASLSDALGWFGTFLQADAAEKEAMEASAASKLLMVLLVLAVICVAAIVGLILLILNIISVVDGTIKSALPPPSPHHGIYAEVFALWLVALLALPTIASALGAVVAKGNTTVSLVFVLCAFFGSLTVLFWARIRGVSLQQIREDIGWTKGEGLFREIGVGLLGYAKTLPILGIGVLLTFVLVLIQGIASGGAEANPLQGTGGGAHPIIVDISQGVWSTQILLLVMAAIAAPLVEETVFRGVLYRQLRSSGRLGTMCNIICSTLLVSFLFAAIHPQGWVAIPALMSIAIGMNMLREWRGTLIPSMVVHGTNNGITVSLMILMFS